MRRIINKYSEKKGSHAGEQGNIDEMESIVFAGKTKEECSETERKLVYIWAYSFSCQKIDVYANFMDYGGDSIIATQIYKEIVSKVCSDLDISDIFTYPTVVSLPKMSGNAFLRNGFRNLCAYSLTFIKPPCAFDNRLTMRKSIRILVERLYKEDGRKNS